MQEICYSSFAIKYLSVLWTDKTNRASHAIKKRRSIAVKHYHYGKSHAIYGTHSATYYQAEMTLM